MLTKEAFRAYKINFFKQPNLMFDFLTVELTKGEYWVRLTCSDR